MCGRYYIQDDLINEIEEIVTEIDAKVNFKGDVFPTNTVPIIYGNQESLMLSGMIWGFSHFNGKGVIINARCESVKTKMTFRDSFLHNRCIIPAAGFYEWDKEKNKVRFERKNSNILYMAGIWKSYEDAKRFVILTTRANDSVRNVHDRMPLLLKENELENWIFKDEFADLAIQKIPSQLNQIRGYEQFRLPF